MARSALHYFAACLACLFLASVSLSAQQQNARFDLAGPKIDVRVTRDGRALPVAQVPNLLEGDHLWLHADLPDTQSVRYLLVVVFLRGTTNPPPEDWIIKIETWNKHVRSEGEEIVVPTGAQQVLLLLAPETGGDISALRSAIRGHPGVFVRASQDLAEAGFEQARIEKYLAEIKQVPPEDTGSLEKHSDLLARTLNLKPNADCFKKPVDQQYGCLTQSGSQSLLDDGHGQTIVNSLTSGASSDLISAASTTQLAGGGAYSAYVGAIVDVVRIMGNLHTAHYQYIPAIAFPKDEGLNLRLNAPPSFQNPKSVIVIGLPAVQQSVAPPLRASDPNHVTCLLKPDVALPVEGAPLVFSTAFAHALSLHRELPVGTLDLPLTPDAFQGGLVIGAQQQRHALSIDDTTPPANSMNSSAATAAGSPADAARAMSNKPDAPAPSEPVLQPATVNGMWGFDPFHGPTLMVQELPGSDWKLAHTEGDHLIVGERNELQLSSTGTACIASIVLEENGQPEQKLEWKPADAPNTVAVAFTLAGGSPGSVRLRLQQFGRSQPEMLSVKAFSKPAQVSAIEFHQGDGFLVLSGQGLPQIQKGDVNGASFTRPAKADSADALSARNENDLRLDLVSGQLIKLKAGEQAEAKITLIDGRALTIPLTIQGARPTLTVLNRRTVRPDGPQTVQLLDPADVPLDSTLMLSLRSNGKFPRDATVQISSDDNSLNDSLSLADGSLVLQDRSTALAQVDLKKTFGGSAFGPLRIRLVLHDGTAGNWMPLVTLVRLPVLTGLSCTGTGELSCTLTGSDLYLVSSVANDRAFTKPVEVPDGFIGESLAVPRPVNGPLFLRLRDNPAAVAIAIPPPQP